MLSLLIFCVASGQGAPAAPVDRSAEPALRQIFENAGAMRNVHVSVESYAREAFANRYTDESCWELWLGEGGRFRMSMSSNMWGGGRLVVSDGLSTLTDSMSDDASIRISGPLKALHEAGDQEPLLYVFEGAPGFDALVDKDQPVKFLQTSPGQKAIELHSKKLGKLVIRYKSDESVPFPWTIDSYKAPWWSDDAGIEGADPYTREEIRVVQYGPFVPGLFVVKAPAGKKVVDDRMKK